jgi:O-methyltransferase domain/Dimerisation domain
MAAVTTLDSVDALNRILDISTAFWKSQTFSAACQLGVFEALGEAPATPEDLARRLGVNPLACRRLLVPLRELGLLEQKADQFQNSELGNFCTSTSPVPLEAASTSTFFYHMWEFLPDAVREYSPRWQQVLGAVPDKAFGALYADPKRLRRFTEWLDAFGTPQGQVLADVIDLSTHHCILDVAGGPGSISIQIGLKHRHLRGMVMDIAPVCAIAREHIQRKNIADRFTAVASDLFAGPYPEGADVILLASVLHDWNEPECQVILRNCFEALPGGGLLLVVEKVLNEDFSGARLDDLMQDLHMLLVSRPGARERTEPEYASLLLGAGFECLELKRLAAPRDVILARKT